MRVCVCVCLNVDHVVDHQVALDHQVHHRCHLVGVHQVQVVVDAYQYRDPLEYHCLD